MDYRNKISWNFWEKKQTKLRYSIDFDSKHKTRTLSHTVWWWHILYTEAPESENQTRFLVRRWSHRCHKYYTFTTTFPYFSPIRIGALAVHIHAVCITRFPYDLILWFFVRFAKAFESCGGVQMVWRAYVCIVPYANSLSVCIEINICIFSAFLNFEKKNKISIVPSACVWLQNIIQLR